MKEQALKLLALIEKTEAEYRAINSQLRKIQSDFPGHIEVMNIKVHSAVIKLLDDILGDEMASYYLYEMPPKEGYVIEKSGKKWVIRNIEDLRAYCLRNEVK